MIKNQSERITTYKRLFTSFFGTIFSQKLNTKTLVASLYPNLKHEIYIKTTFRCHTLKAIFKQLKTHKLKNPKMRLLPSPTKPIFGIIDTRNTLVICSFGK